MKREPYLSDLSDEQWLLIEPMITAWKQDRVARSATGDPGSCEEKALVDQGFKNEVVIHGALMDIDVEVVRRNPADQGKGFVPQPKRWCTTRSPPEPQNYAVRSST